MLLLDHYNHFFINRTRMRGGGVAMHITRRMQCEVVTQFTCVTADYETLCLQHKNELFAVVYRPPSGNPAVFFNFLEAVLEYATLNRYRLLLGGDLNIDISKDDCLSRELENKISASGFLNVITTPTRVTPSCQSILDLFITNIDAPILNAGTISCDISDHCPVFIAYSCTEPPLGGREPRYMYRSFSSENMNYFRARVSEHDWSSVYGKDSVDAAYNEFLANFTSIYNESFPIKCVKVKRRIRKPWVGPNEMKMIIKKNKLFKAFLRTRDPATLAEFKRHRNKVNSELKKSKAAYFDSLFLHAREQHRNSVWKIINNFLKRKNESDNALQLKINNQEISGLALAEHFNKHFTSTPAQLANLRNPPNLYKANSTIFMRPTDVNEITSTFSNLKNTKSTDVNGLQIGPVKYVIDIIVPYLEYIFNLVLESGSFPYAMKQARVSVIFKAGNKNEPTNYRPISILPVFSKGLEKVVLTRLNNFFAKNNLLTDCQHGFRPGKSTETALLTLKEKIIENIESNKLTLAIFIDFSKAFDYLNRDLLLEKLDSYGVRGVAFSLIRSYLSDREQCVAIGDSVSSFLSNHSGVPQGSVLGPFLFNIYVNDIVEIDKNAQFILYADDTTILVSGLDIHEVTKKAEHVLEKLSLWSDGNALKINASKSKAILFQAKNKHANIHNDLKLGSVPIEIVRSYKILGVTFSTTLSWNCHIQSLSKSLSAAVGALSRCRHLFPIAAKLQIYHALFASHINYCTLVWGTTTIGNLNTITLLQKKALRSIANVAYSHTTSYLFPKYRIIRAKYVFDFKLLHSYFFSNKNSQGFTKTLTNLRVQESDPRTRTPDMWLVPRRRTNYLLQSITHRMPFILNSLEEKGIRASTLSRRQLREYFFK